MPLAVLCVLVPAVPIVVGLIIGGGGAGAGTSTGATFTPVRPLLGSQAGTATGRATAPRVSGALVALVHRPTTMRVAPGAQPLAKLPLRTEFGSPEVLWVVRQAPGWLGVVSPLAGNGRIGWIPKGVATLRTIYWELRVSLAARRLEVIDRGNVVERYTIAIGAPSAPTPTGRFAVTDRLSTGDPSGPYGCCILALSAHSPHAIQGWTGGDRIAIHSTNDIASIGEAVSHGCMRLTMDEGRWLMAHLPLGTPTLIHT